MNPISGGLSLQKEILSRKDRAQLSDFNRVPRFFFKRVFCLPFLHCDSALAQPQNFFAYFYNIGEENSKLLTSANFLFTADFLNCWYCFANAL
jgi:hypothetical protein